MTKKTPESKSQSLKYKCSSCGEETAVIYLSENTWICWDCYSGIVKEKLPTAKAQKRLKSYKKLLGAS
jgi:ribosomal protein L37AE/L43A